MATTQALSFHFIRVSQVKILNACIEEASYVRDESMLESAVNSPSIDSTMRMKMIQLDLLPL